MNAAAIVLAALAHVDDTTFCCASELWFNTGELPFEVFYCHQGGGMFCGVSVSWWPPRSLKPSPLEINQESPEIGFLTLGLILCEPAVGVLTMDCQFHGPWDAEVTWGLDNDIAGPWGAVAGTEEGEVSGGVLVGGEGVAR